MSTFGERLVAERKKIGFSQKEFAEKLEITPTRLNYWEKDKREPDFFFIKKILLLLNCDSDYLLGTNSSIAQISLSNDEQQLLTNYRQLDDSKKEFVRQAIMMSMNSTKKNTTNTANDNKNVV